MGGVTRTRHRFWQPVAADGVAVHGLRRRRPRDLAACARLLRVVHYESRYPYEWPREPRAWLDDDVLDAWVVERQDEILGHVSVSRLGHDTVSAYRWREMTGHEPTRLAAVGRLFVRPKARRQGLGSALLDTAVSDIQDRGLLPVLEVVDCNRDAVRLYEDRGWRLLSMDLWGDRSARLRVNCYAAPRGW